MQEFIQELLTYNDDANRRYLHAICDADLASGRVFTIFNHILNSHRIWNTRIGGVSPTGGVWDEHPAEQWAAIKTDAINAAKLGEKNPEAVMLMDRVGWK